MWWWAEWGGYPALGKGTALGAEKRVGGTQFFFVLGEEGTGHVKELRNCIGLVQLQLDGFFVHRLSPLQSQALFPTGKSG